MTDDRPDEPVEIAAKPVRKHVRTSGLQAPRVRAVKPRRKTNVPPDWRNDLNLLKRLEALSRFASMGWTGAALYQQLQAWLLSQGLPGTSWRTFKLGQARLLTLLKEFPQATAEEIAESVRTTKREAWRQALNPKSTRAVDSLRVVNDSDLLLAKLSGIVDERGNVNVQVGVKVDTPSKMTFDPANDSPTLRAALLVLRGDRPLLTDGESGLDDEISPGSQPRLAGATEDDE